MVFVRDIKVNIRHKSNFNSTLILVDNIGNEYVWRPSKGCVSVRHLMLHKTRHLLRDGYNIILSGQVLSTVLEKDGSTRFYLQRVTLYYTEEFIQDNIDTLIREYRGGKINLESVDRTSVSNLVRLQKIPEHLITYIYNTLLDEVYDISIARNFIFILSKFQKYSGNFILENIDWLDVEYLSISHLSKNTQLRIKMFSELKQ